MKRTVCYLFILAAVAALDVIAFSRVSPLPSKNNFVGSRWNIESSQCSSPLVGNTVARLPVLFFGTESLTESSDDVDDVTCYVVNDEDIITEGEKPHVVCTSEPDDVSYWDYCEISG